MGVGLMDDATKAITSDLKKAGDRIYLVGTTKDQMAGSALYARHDAPHRHAPDVDVKALSASIDVILETMAAGQVAACHDISDGGMVVALAEMCIGGQLGADVDIAVLGRMRPMALLFSESATRWLIEVPGVKGRSVEARFKKAGVPLTLLGKVTGPTRTGKMKKPRPVALKARSGKKVLFNIHVSELEDAWSRPFWEHMG
jgi:phosphoribosylformylglycinamidine synthase